MSRTTTILISVLRSVAIVACILGILAGLYIMFLGGGQLGPAIRTVAHFSSSPIALLFKFNGAIALAIPSLGLIAIIGAGFAKSMAAKILFNTLGGIVLTVVLGFGLITYDHHEKQQEALRRAERAHQTLLVTAERGDSRSQARLAEEYFSQWRSRRDQSFCPEALYWSQQSAYQGNDEGQARLGTVYDQCAPGNSESNSILAYVWHTISIENPTDRPFFGGGFDAKKQVFGSRPKPTILGEPLEDVLAKADMMIDRAQEILADYSISAAERQTAIEGAFQELLPSIEIFSRE
jgi:hypothetical protein